MTQQHAFNWETWPNTSTWTTNAPLALVLVGEPEPWWTDNIGRDRVRR